MAFIDIYRFLFQYLSHHSLLGLLDFLFTTTAIYSTNMCAEFKASQSGQPDRGI